VCPLSGAEMRVIASFTEPPTIHDISRLFDRSAMDVQKFLLRCAIQSANADAGPQGVHMGCFDYFLPIKLADAEIRAIAPAGGETHRVRFILKTYKLEKKNDFSEISAPGLNGEPLQFVRSHSRTLSTVFYFDERATNTDVRQSMKNVADLMNVDRQTHAPPVLSFEWAGFTLKCVLESVAQEFTSLFPDGRPLRGRMHVRLKEMLSLQELLQEAGRQ
jgi:hypothetical protein